MQKQRGQEEKMIQRYEMPELELQYFTNQDVLTASEEVVGPGDGWVKDPFVQE